VTLGKGVPTPPQKGPHSWQPYHVTHAAVSSWGLLHHADPTSLHPLEGQRCPTTPPWRAPTPDYLTDGVVGLSQHGWRCGCYKMGYSIRSFHDCSSPLYTYNWEWSSTCCAHATTSIIALVAALHGGSHDLSVCASSWGPEIA
jgi:hypothetical protein